MGSLGPDSSREQLGSTPLDSGPFDEAPVLRRLPSFHKELELHSTSIASNTCAQASIHAGNVYRYGRHVMTGLSLNRKYVLRLPSPQ